MAKSSLVVEIRLKWWFVYLYIPMLSGLYRFMVNCIDADCSINPEKLEWYINKAISVRSCR